MLPVSKHVGFGHNHWWDMESSPCDSSRQCQNWSCPYKTTTLELVGEGSPGTGNSFYYLTDHNSFLQILLESSMEQETEVFAKHPTTPVLVLLSRPAQGAAWPSAQIFVPSWHGSPQFSSPALHPPGRTFYRRKSSNFETVDTYTQLVTY